MFAFEDIRGHARLIAALKAAIRHRQVGHAYIFEGARGAGKTLLAKAFAKALQCEAGTETACGECMSCRQFDSGNQPDVLYPAPTKTKALGVDDVREQINHAAETKPYMHRYKIFIVEDAGALSPAAQNALLKTLEEPPSYVVFLLLAENTGQLLPTILSRCVTFKLHPLPADDVAQYLTIHAQIDADTARLSAVYAQGSIGRALEIAADAQFAELRACIVDLMAGIRDRDLTALFQAVKTLETYKDHIQDALDVAFLWFRDLATILVPDGEAFLLQQDLSARLAAEAETTHSAAVHAQLEAIWRAKQRLRQNGNFQMVLEVLMLDLQEA